MASFIYIALKCPSFLIFQTTDLVCEGKNDKAAVTIQLIVLASMEQAVPVVSSFPTLYRI